MPSPSGSPLPKGALEELAQVLCELRRRDIHHFVKDGTLLGLYRDGRLITHDSDLDIGIIGTRSAFEVSRLMIKHGWHLGQVVWVKGDVYHLTFYSSGGSVLDFHFFLKSGKYAYSFPEFDSFFVYPLSLVGEPQLVSMGGILGHCPQDIEGFLEYTYGVDWRIPKGAKSNWQSEEYGPVRWVDRPFDLIKSVKKGALLHR